MMVFFENNKLILIASIPYRDMTNFQTGKNFD